MMYFHHVTKFISCQTPLPAARYDMSEHMST